MNYRPTRGIFETLVNAWLRPWQGNPALTLVLTTAIAIGGLAALVGFKEKELGHAFVGVDLGRQGGRVGELQGDMTFPLGFQGGDIDDNPAAGIGALAQADD